jgi:chromosome partitioning protein
MPIVSAINLKGGVGKTSLCLHLAGALSMTGRRILAVDNDPQSSLTAGFLGAQPTRHLDPAGTIAAIYTGEDPLPGAVIRPTGFKGIDLLPGSRHAVGSNIPHPHKAPYADQVLLRDFLAQVCEDYDVVLIDCPPNLHMASWAAMAASDAFVVPVQPEDFGAQGTQDVIESAAGVRAVINPHLTLAGYVVSMYQARRAVHQAYVEHLRASHGVAVFASVIPMAAEFAEAVTARKPVAFHKPKGAAAKAIRALAEELAVRLAAISDRSGAGEAA